MNTNSRTLAEIQIALEALLTELRAVTWSEAPAGSLVPLALSLKASCDHAALVHSEIELRAIANNTPVPGVAVKDSVTQRKWNDEESAASLAFEAYGLKAFKLVAPASIEKLGGEALVAIASFKPPAGKRVVY